MSLLPLLLSAILLFILVTRVYSRQTLVRRRLLPFFLSAVTFATLTVILTEALSVFSALSPKGLVNAWRLLAALLLVLNLVLPRRFSRPPWAPRAGEARRRPSLLALRVWLKAHIGSACHSAVLADRLSVLLTSALACLLLLTLAVALVYPPNNYDSMAYHVARVMHWAQQRSVAYYPTAIVMQVQGAPLAEFFLLHLYVLTGTDVLFNLSQWISFLMAILAVYSAAELLFPRGGLAAAVLAGTIPMGVLQATSTQNDLVAASWLAVSVYLGLCVLHRVKITFLLPFTTLAFGLAVLTKPTVLPMAGCFAIVFFGYLVSRRVPLRALIMSATLMFLPSIPFYARNLAFYGVGSPYGPGWGLPVQEVSATGVISNLIRGVALHSQTPLPGFICDVFNSGSLGALRMFHEVLRVRVDDPRFSLTKANAFQPYDVFHEDVSGNPLHLILFLIMLPVAVVGAFRTGSGFAENRWRVVASRALPLMGCVAAGFVGVWGYLKWSQFATRYDLALFVLACVPLGGCLSGFGRLARVPLLAAYLCYGFAAVCLNATRPVSPPLSAAPLDRTASYFITRPDVLKPYMEIARTIKGAGCHQVGYRNGNDNFEYPFWVVLREGGYQFRFEHVEFTEDANYRQRSYRLRDASFEPCAVISLADWPERTPGFEDVRVGEYHVYVKRARL